jgi:hypothetical protein
MGQPIKPETWYLARTKNIRSSERGKPIYVLFEVVQGPSIGELLPDTFYLTEKAISRFETLAHRCGYEAEIKTAEQADVKAVAAILGKKVWFKTKLDERDGKVIRIDGWHFRSETDPPEDEAVIDYRARDENEIAMDGL